MFRKIYDSLASLNLGIWLIIGVLLLMAAGSFGSGASEAGSINDMPLFAWLRGASAFASWWLWGAIVLLALLAVNTVFCSIESLRSKFRSGNFLIIIAPQVMHAGFLLIMLAHLLSAYGGSKQIIQVGEGSAIGSPDGSTIRIERISGSVGPMGMMTDFGAEFRYVADGRERTSFVSPNHPLFHNGFGIYVKDVAIVPEPAALLEIHREPGAGAALAGALLFTVGNIVLLTIRKNR